MSNPTLPGYEDLELIGKGGFSRVYRAHQSKLKRQVAVKVLNFGLNDEADRVSFARETELMGRVSAHPNIVTVHDTAFTRQGQPCIVMEHYPGGSLADLINEVGRLNTQEALEVGVAIASALEASHRSGVLHCDLKPQNILISEFGQPALGDFGISTFAEDRTRTGQDAGAGFTLPYAAPEIVEGESPMVASDVYSLAATLYTALCGRRPFAYPTNDNAKPTAAEQARRILVEPVPPLLAEQVPPALDALICQAMAKDPADRPATAASFAAACHRIGQELGLATTAPRIATQGALPMIDSAAVGQGGIDLSKLVRQRDGDGDEQAAVAADEDVAPSSPSALVTGSSAAELATDATSSSPGLDRSMAQASDGRRRFAAVIGIAAVVVVAAVLFVSTRGSGDTEPAVQADEVASATVAAANPIVAPTRPSLVELERRGDHGVAVSWQVPSDELALGDITYEVRRQDTDGAAVIITTTTDAFLPAVANNEGVCVTVLAVRANRTSTPTEPVCSTPMTVDIEVAPAVCTAPCSLQVHVDSSQPSDVHTIEIVNRELVDMTGRGFAGDDSFVPASGAALLRVDDGVEPGGYLVIVRLPDDSTQTALLTIEG